MKISPALLSKIIAFDTELFAVTVYNGDDARRLVTGNNKPKKMIGVAEKLCLLGEASIFVHW